MLNPGKNGVCEIWMYEGQVVTTTGTQGMLLPSVCGDGHICNHLKHTQTCEPYLPNDYGSHRYLYSDIMDLYCRIQYVWEDAEYAYTEGDMYRYVNFMVYGLLAGDYSYTYNHYNSYIYAVEDYEDEDGFEDIRVLSERNDLEYSFTLKIHVLPQNIEGNYFTLKPGVVFSPSTPVPFLERYFVDSPKYGDALIDVGEVRLGPQQYQTVVEAEHSRKDVFIQQGNDLVTKTDRVEYGQWISMYAPYYFWDGQIDGIHEYDRFHITVSNTDLNVTKKTMKVGDTFKLRIKDGTTFSIVEEYRLEDGQESKIGYLKARDRFEYCTYCEEYEPSIVKLSVDKKAYEKEEISFHYVKVTAANKGKCLLKVYPYENDENYFFVCEVTVK